MTAFHVTDIIRRDAPVLSPETPIRRAAAILVDTGSAGASVIGDHGELVGILSQKDCFRSALHASYHREWKGCVADRMTSDVVSIDESEEIIRAAEMFLEHPHRVFPALRDGNVAGLLYRTDVLAFLMRHG